MKYAASNNIIMVFPQAAPDTSNNKSGCWNMIKTDATEHMVQQTKEGV